MTCTQSIKIEPKCIRRPFVTIGRCWCGDEPVRSSRRYYVRELTKEWECHTRTFRALPHLNWDIRIWCVLTWSSRIPSGWSTKCRGYLRNMTDTRDILLLRLERGHTTEHDRTPQDGAMCITEGQTGKQSWQRPEVTGVAVVIVVNIVSTLGNMVWLQYSRLERDDM